MYLYSHILEYVWKSIICEVIPANNQQKQENVWKKLSEQIFDRPPLTLLCIKRTIVHMLRNMRTIVHMFTESIEFPP